MIRNTNCQNIKIRKTWSNFKSCTKTEEVKNTYNIVYGESVTINQQIVKQSRLKIGLVNELSTLSTENDENCEKLSTIHINECFVLILQKLAFCSKRLTK